MSSSGSNGSSSVSVFNIVNRAAKLEDRITANKKRNIFISYCWAFRAEQVRTIAQRLETKGYNVWLDVKVLDDRLFDEIAKGIDNCHIFIMFFNDAYISSENCQMEATYALKTVKKPTLAINMTGRKPEGNWLALILQDRVWINFGNELHVDQVFEEIIERIWRRFDCGDVEGFADHCSYSFIPINVPNFSATGYYSRPEDEERIFKQIIETCEKPGSGILVIAGDGGVGKTTMIARLFVNKRPISGNTIVIWLNCFRWREDDKFDDLAEKMFAEELVSLAKAADPAFQGQTVASILPHFQTKGSPVLFVFDDVFSALVMQRFITRQTNSAQLSCCAITRDPTALAFGTDITRAIEKLDALSNQGIKVMLETFYGMKEKLTADRLTKLSESCCGLPLIAGLLYSKFRFTDRSLWNLRCDKLLREELKNMQVQDKAERPFKTVSQLFQFSIEQLNYELRERYKVFLFFDPAVSISVQDLEILWRLPRDSWETKEIIEQFEQRSLIRPADKTTSEGENCYMVHQMLWEAAHEMFAKKAGESLQQVCTKLAMDPLSSMVDAFEIVRRLRRPLLKQIIARLDVENLGKLCLRHSPTMEPGNNKKLYRRTFIHFLSNFKWPDNVEGVYTYNYSYLLVGDILLKIKSQGRVDLLNQIATTTSIGSANGEQQDSFLLDLFSREHEVFSYFERLTAKRIMNPWKTHYEEMKWRNDMLTGDKPIRLVQAAIRNNVDEFQLLFQDGKVEEEELLEALIAGARCNAKEIVAYLVKSLPENLISTPVGDDQKAAVHFAAANGHFDIVRDLVEQTGTKAVTKNGSTTLHFAAENGHLVIVKFLVEKHFDLPLMTRSDGWTVAHSAANNGHLEIVRYFAERHPGILSMTKNNGWSVLHCAADNGQVESVQYLAEQQPSLLMMTRNDGWTVLHSAATNGHLETVRYLADHHSNLITMARANGRTVLHCASANGHFDIVHYLVEKQPSLLLTADNDGWTGLHSAAANGHVEIARLLIDKHPKLLTTTRNDGWTALHLAVKHEFINMVRFLVELQPELLTMVTNSGVTVLHCAAEKGHVEITNYLVEKSPHLITTAASDGSTALHLAIEHFHLKIVRSLCEMCPGVISMVRNDGWTVLHSAVETEYPDAVRYLVEKQPILISMATKDGLTVSNLAKACEDLEIQNLLVIPLT